MKRKAFIVLFGAVLLLMATALTEYLFYRQDENTWVERFESRLHEQERKADHLLATFRDSVDIDSEEWEEDLIFVGIREGRVFFWTNEIIGDRHLSELLTSGRNFTKIGNTYYEIRRKRHQAQVSVSANVSIAKPHRMPTMVDSYTFARAMNEAGTKWRRTGIHQ